MRGRMDATKSYAKHVELGEVMAGGTVGEVVESRHPGFKAGDFVIGRSAGRSTPSSTAGRAQGGRLEGAALLLSGRRSACPASPPGSACWTSAQPQAGETVVVSAASGAVGSVVGQIAKIKGCRAVGIAGGAEKCGYVTGSSASTPASTHRAGRLPRGPAGAPTPKGIDVVFENVGGPVLDAVLRLMNPFGRITICGLISQYNATEPYGIRTCARC